MGLIYMPGICRECGCDDEHACIDTHNGGPCRWVEPDLCSACVEYPGEEDDSFDDGFFDPPVAPE